MELCRCCMCGRKFVQYLDEDVQIVCSNKCLEEYIEWLKGDLDDEETRQEEDLKF
jgi:hypothetical protein